MFSAARVQVALVGGEEHSAAVGAADGQEFMLVVVHGGAVTQGTLDVKGRGPELVVLEAVQGAQPLCPCRPAFGCKIVEFRGVTEHQVCCRVGVYSAVFADGIKAGGVGAEGQGCDAVGPPCVGHWLRRHGEGCLLSLTARLDVSRVPELDGGIGLGGSEEEVFPAGGEPLYGGDGGYRCYALYSAFVGIVDGVDCSSSDGVEGGVTVTGAVGVGC